MDFNEIKEDLVEILAESNLTLPEYRLKNVLNRLEESYIELTHKKDSITDEYKKEEQKVISTLSTNISRLNQRKIIIVGLQGAGKTSIYQVIFENVLPHETRDLKPTKGLSRHSLNLFKTSKSGYEKLDEVDSKIKNQLIVWDLGGQEQFLNRYLTDPEHYFNQADLVIFVIDASDVEKYEKARVLFHKILYLLDEKSLLNTTINLENRIYCFMHKMDHFANRDEQYENLKEYFKLNPDTSEKTNQVSYLSTSIYDSSIHTAWTKIMQEIMPKSSKLNLLAQNLKKKLGLFAAFVIEKRTGLPVCSSKTLLDENALVGSTNRILISLERVLPEFQLTGLNELSLKTKNGFLRLTLFNEYYYLVLLYPHSISLDDVKSKEKIESFIRKARRFI